MLFRSLIFAGFLVLPTVARSEIQQENRPASSTSDGQDIARRRSVGNWIVNREPRTESKPADHGASQGLKSRWARWFGYRENPPVEPRRSNGEPKVAGATDPTTNRRAVTASPKEMNRRDDPNKLVSAAPKETRGREVIFAASDSAGRLPQHSVVAENTPPHDNARYALLITNRDIPLKDRPDQSMVESSGSTSDSPSGSAADTAEIEPSRPRMASLEASSGRGGGSTPEAATRESSGHTPGLLPPHLGTVERHLASQSNDGGPATADQPSDVAEASLTSDIALTAAPVASIRSQGNPSTSLAAASPYGTELLGTLSMPALLGTQPTECYLILMVLSVATLALLFSRRSSTKQSTEHTNQYAPMFPGFTWWPSGVAERDSRDGLVMANHAGVAAGTIMATVGLAVLAVGAVALLRGHLFGQVALRRPGLWIAACGQGILLFGLAAQAVYKARQVVAAPRSNGIQNAQAAAGIWPGMIPVLPINPGYGWPVPMPVVASAPNQSGQIAQIKAQLACLSQQLDQLSTPSSSS